MNPLPEFVITHKPNPRIFLAIVLICSLISAVAVGLATYGRGYSAGYAAADARYATDKSLQERWLSGFSVKIVTFSNWQDLHALVSVACYDPNGMLVPCPLPAVAKAADKLVDTARTRYPGLLFRKDLPTQ